MKRESVTDFIDRRIHESMVDGFPIACIKQDIEIRYRNMRRSILTEVTADEFDELLKGDLDKIERARTKYVAFYVYHAKKRLSDLDWVFKNRSKFPRLSNSQIFKLDKLKERLQPIIP